LDTQSHIKTVHPMFLLTLCTSVFSSECGNATVSCLKQITVKEREESIGEKHAASRGLLVTAWFFL